MSIDREIKTTDRLHRFVWLGRKIPASAATAVIMVLAALCLSRPTTAHSQIVGPALDRHALEIGYIYKWYERNFDSVFLGQESWSAGTAYFRYGVCRWVTMSIEGAIRDLHGDDIQGTDYRRYAIGGGLTAIVHSESTWRVEASGHYSEVFDHDRSVNQFHKNARDLLFVVQIERFLGAGDQSVVVWAGPAIAYDESRQFPWGAHQPVKDDTSNNFGFAVGLNAVLFGRVSVFFHGVGVDTFQPRAGAGVQF